MKALIAFNLLGMIGCTIVGVVWPSFAEVDVCMNFTNLDRAGVINESALDQFDPSLRLKENVRRNVPLYIAGPALD